MGKDMTEERKSEQMNMKVTPSFKAEVMDFLMALGYAPDENALMKFDQERLANILELAKKSFIYDQNSKYAEVAKSIEQYESLINSKLLSLIADLNNTEARVRSEFEKQLTAKDQLITDLQEQKKDEETAKKDAIKDAAEHETAKSLAEKALTDTEEKLRKSEETINDKERYIQTLLEKLSEAEAKLAGYEDLKASEATLKEQLMEARHINSLTENEKKHIHDLLVSAQNTISSIENKMSETASQRDDAEKRLSKIEGESESIKRELNELQARSTQALEEQRFQFETSIEQMKDTFSKEKDSAVEIAVSKARSEMQEQISQLREEKSRLEAKLELLYNHEKVSS